MQRHNFAFLDAYEAADIANHASSAEAYLRENPAATLWLLRVCGEALAKRILTHCQIEVGKSPKFEDLINKLRFVRRVKVSEQIIGELTRIRLACNPAVHSGLAERAEAEGCLRLTHSLAGRYVRLFFDDNFKTPAFVVPPSSQREAENLREQLRSAENLRKAIEEENVALRRREAEALAALAAQNESLTEMRALELQRRMDLEDKTGSAAFSWDRPSVWLELSNQLEHFVGRESELQFVREWESSTTSSDYLLVVGSPGYGKSALMAKIAESLYGAGDQNASDRTPVLLDMPSGGRDQRTVLRFLLWQAWNLSKRETERPRYSGSISALRDNLVNALAALIEDYGRVLLVVDGIDELIQHHDQAAKELLFLPEHLPHGAKAVLSCRPNDAITEHLERRLSHPEKLQLQPLPSSAAEDLLFKRLDPSAFLWLESTVSMERILTKTGGVPLFLRYVASRATNAIREQQNVRPRHRLTYQKDSWVPSSLDDLFREVYREIEQGISRRRTRGGNLRKTLVHLLALSLGGSSLTELVCALRSLDVTANTSQVRQALGEIAPYVRKGSERYSLYHEAFSQYLADYLGADGRALMLRALALPVAAETAEPPGSLLRRLSYALQWHAESRRASDAPSAVRAATMLGTALTDFATLANFLEQDHLFDIVPLLSRAADECATDMDSRTASLLVSWARLINDQLAVLSERPWLLFQTAVNAEDATIVASATASSAALGRSYMRRVTTRQMIDENKYPRLRSFPHTDGIDGQRCISVSAEVGTIALLRGETVGCWEIESGRVLWTVHVQYPFPDWLVCISNSGRYVALPTYECEYASDSTSEDWDGSDPVDVLAGLALYGAEDGRPIWERPLQVPGFVDGLTFTPDDKFLFLGSGDPRYWSDSIAEDGRGTICKIDVQSGTLAIAQRGLSPISSLLLSPNGDVLVSATSDPTQSLQRRARLDFWDAKNLAHLRTVNLESSSVVALNGYTADAFVAVTADGRIRILSFDGDAILSIDTGDLHLKQLVAIPATNLAFTLSQSKLIAPVHLKCWDLSAGIAISDVQYPYSELCAIASARGEQELLMASRHRLSLRSIDAARKRNVIRSVPVLNGVGTGRLVAASPDLRSLAFEGENGALDIRDAITSQQLHCISPLVPDDTPRNERPRVRKVVALSSADRYAFVACALWKDLMSVVSIYDLARDAMVLWLPLPGLDVIDATLGQDGSTVAILVRSRPLDTKERDLISSVLAKAIGELVAAYGNDLSRLPHDQTQERQSDIALALVGEYGDAVCVIDLSKMQLLWRFGVGRELPSKVRLAPDGSAIAVSGHGWVRVWDIAGRSMILALGTDPGDQRRRSIEAFVYALNPAAASDKIEDIDLEAEFVPETSGFSSDGQLFFVGGKVRHWIGLVRRWMLPACEELSAFPLSTRGPLTTTLDGRNMLTAIGAGISVRSIADGQEVGFWPTELPPINIVVRDEGRIAYVDSTGRSEVLEYCDYAKRRYHH